MQSIKLKRVKIKSAILFIFSISLLIRLLFVFWGSGYFYEGSIHLNGDSGSYSNSFINLYETGHYTHNPTISDASFGRLPGYPVYWGIHYLVFGPENVYLAVSISQAVLDSISSVLILLLAYHFTRNKIASLFAGLLYAFYPFSIVWITITGTETLASFVTLLFFYILITRSHSHRNLILIGLVLAMAFYTREYLGILLPLTGLYFWRKYGFRSGLKKTLIPGLVFIFLYLPWPIRNYVNHEQIVLLKPATAGYTRYTKDVDSFRSWLFSWHPSDWNPWFEEIVHGTDEVEFPLWVFASEQEKILADRLVDLCRTCGSGFHVWKTNQPLPVEDCNDEISAGFQQLRTSFIKHKPFVYFVKAPMESIFKSFFNLQVDSQKEKPRFTYLTFVSLFVARGLLLLILLATGLCILPRNVEAALLDGFFLFMILFISFYMRQVEMRYLLQAEVMLLPFAAPFIKILQDKFISPHK